MRSYQKHINDMENKRARKLKEEKGFSLLEVLVAISVLSIGILAVASMQIGAIQGNSFAGHVTEGTTWAQDKLEELMALPYEDPWLEAAGNPPGLDSAGNTHEEVNSPYTIRWNVTDNDPLPNTKLITVTAARQVKGVTKTTELISIKSKF